jgi:DNA-binding GntR family transcriptional regulator
MAPVIEYEMGKTMTIKHDLGYRSLNELVYDYLRSQIQTGSLKPGDPINMDQTAKKLSISKTPLREALIKLETEGFVKIIPWQGVFVGSLTIHDFKEGYQILSILESQALLYASARMKPEDVQRMQELNNQMKEAIESGDFESYYRKNIEFHSTYINLTGNQLLINAIDILKKRLYEFSRPMEFIKEWEDISIAEHQHLIDLLRQGRYSEAKDYLFDVIWNFEVQEKFIIKYYRFDKEK